MKISVMYTAQLRNATGCSFEELEIPDSAAVADVLRRAEQEHGETLGRYLRDESGNLKKTILIFVNEDQVRPDDEDTLTPGDTVTLMSPIAGG